MRRRQRLQLAALWLLLTSACADEPPAKAPRALPPRARPEVAHVSVAASRQPPAAPLRPEISEKSALPAVGSQTHNEAQLAERFARSRPLALQHGSASYYSDAFTGRSTASGAPYEPRGYTAAHRSLPFGTVLRVTRVDGGQVVYVRVTDRGPFGPRGRILDLSRAAAERLGMLRAGVVKVKCEVMEYGPRKARRRRR